MSTVGQRERKTQQRVLKLLQDELGYHYLGNWEEREANCDEFPQASRRRLPSLGLHRARRDHGGECVAQSACHPDACRAVALAKAEAYG